MTKVDVAGQRVRFLAVDQNLHVRDRRQVDRERVDDGVDGEQLVERAAGMLGTDVAADVDERVAAFADEEGFESRSGRYRRRERCRGRGQLRLDDMTGLFDRR